MIYDREYFTRNPWSTNQSFHAKELSIVNLRENAELYLYNINTEQELKIRMIPDTVSESYAMRIVSVSPFGRIRPLNFYTGGDTKELSFSFTVFEDQDFVGGNIYDFLEKFKAMSTPVRINSTVMPPLVYFQLGSQFAGKGHITTSFNLDKPFRNGRYSTIECSVTFVFHEEFDAQDIVFEGDSGEDIYAGLSFTYEGNVVGFDSFGDFINITASTEYFITQVFSNAKMEQFFNVIIEEAATNNFGWQEATDTAREEVAQIASGAYVTNTPDSTGSYILNAYRNPFGIDLVNYVNDFARINNEQFSPATTFTNLKNLLGRVQALENTYRNSTLPTWDTLYGLPETETTRNEIGWYTDYRGFTVKMSDKEMEAFEESLEFLLSMITALIAMYSSLLGAGE